MESKKAEMSITANGNRSYQTGKRTIGRENLEGLEEKFAYMIQLIGEEDMKQEIDADKERGSITAKCMVWTSWYLKS